MGALFLFPVLVAAALVWRLPPAAWLLAAAISSAVQVAISMLAYATQLAVVRVAAPARRRTVWMGLRLVAALALAAVWMVGTWVLRAPAALAAKLGAVAWWANLTPGGLIVAPLAALVRGETAVALAALGLLCLVAAAALLLAVAVARRAGMRGWEEAGAPWAEAAPIPSGRARPITAANKDLRLITRDRGQVLVLIAMPAIFVGIQIFGSAGWTWSTASLGAHLLSGLLAGALHGHHRPADPHAGRAARVLDPAHGPGAARPAVRRQGARLVGRGGRARRRLLSCRWRW